MHGYGSYEVWSPQREAQLAASNYERTSPRREAQLAAGNYDILGDDGIFSPYAGFGDATDPLRGRELAGLLALTIISGGLVMVRPDSKQAVIAATEWFAFKQSSTNPAMGEILGTAVSGSYGVNWVRQYVANGYVVMMYPTPETNSVKTIMSNNPLSVANRASAAGGYIIVDGPAAIIAAAQGGGGTLPSGQCPAGQTYIPLLGCQATPVLPGGGGTAPTATCKTNELYIPYVGCVPTSVLPSTPPGGDTPPATGTCQAGQVYYPWVGCLPGGIIPSGGGTAPATGTCPSGQAYVPYLGCVVVPSGLPGALPGGGTTPAAPTCPGGQAWAPAQSKCVNIPMGVEDQKAAAAIAGEKKLPSWVIPAVAVGGGVAVIALIWAIKKK